MALGTVALITADIRVSIESWWTVTLVTSGQILAQSILATGFLSIFHTFIYITALLSGLVSNESLTTDAHICT